MSETPTGRPPDPSPSQVETDSTTVLSLIRLLHKAHSSSQADIWLVQWGRTQCVLRDYSTPRAWYWRRLCRWAVRREIHVHRLLDGLSGIPRLLAILDQDRYLIEYIDGPPLACQMQPLDTGFFEHLAQIIVEMHARGVAHGDLRNKNILVGPGQMPNIVDFSTAWWGTSLWRMPLFRLYERLDRRRLALSKAKFLPDLFEDRELYKIKKGPFYIRLGRIYRRFIYSFLSPRRRARSAHRE